MNPAVNGKKDPEIQLAMERDTRSTSRKLREFIPIDFEIALKENRGKNRFLDFLKARPSKDWLMKSAPISFMKRIGSRSSGPLPVNPPITSASERRRFRVPFVRKINWSKLVKTSKDWAKDPMNMAFLVWFFFVVVGIFMTVLLMLGCLNGVITKSEDRDRWSEMLNQIVNALFTIMCLYQHPYLFHHLILLIRWNPIDRIEVRKVYCKDIGPRVNERSRMIIVVILFHITCLAQYILCVLYWTFTSKTRPDWANYLLMAIGTVAPVFAGLYTVYGPLGKKSDLESAQESQHQETESTAIKLAPFELRQFSRRVAVPTPRWVGGIFDCWDDITVAYLSFFCTFCVFGWNMERLGFGNMYVHIFTFILLLIAPFWVFNATALNISNDTVRIIFAVCGVVLCFLGLLYGGFWRIQMRKKFKLPGNPFCCGFPAMTDSMQWLFCWACSLAQEVRTVNLYDVEDQSFYQWESEEEIRRPGPLPREGGYGPLIRAPSVRNSVRGNPDSVRGNPDSVKNGEERASVSIKTARESSLEEELPTSRAVSDTAMRPPIQPLIQLEDNQTMKS